MWCRFLLLGAVVGALQAADLATTAQAQDKFPCEAFVRLGDGTWQAMATTLIPDGNFRVQEGSLWRPGATVMGTDVATMLDKECPNVPVYNPQAQGVPGGPVPGAPAPLQAQAPQAPRVSLARYADANGNIDVRTLTCGHLDDASPEEADLLLTWYSGGYNASSKGHSINLSRLRTAVHSVVDYCRANPDKNLVRVMELMLK
jgi:hypothetical protein